MPLTGRPPGRPWHRRPAPARRCRSRSARVAAARRGETREHDGSFLRRRAERRPQTPAIKHNRRSHKGPSVRNRPASSGRVYRAVAKPGGRPANRGCGAAHFPLRSMVRSLLLQHPEGRGRRRDECGAAGRAEDAKPSPRSRSRPGGRPTRDPPGYGAARNVAGRLAGAWARLLGRPWRTCWSPKKDGRSSASALRQPAHPWDGIRRRGLHPLRASRRAGTRASAAACCRPVRPPDRERPESALIWVVRANPAALFLRKRPAAGGPSPHSRGRPAGRSGGLWLEGSRRGPPRSRAHQRPEIRFRRLGFRPIPR